MRRHAGAALSGPRAAAGGLAAQAPQAEQVAGDAQVVGEGGVVRLIHEAIFQSF
jgi:hypothetical protein